MLLVIETFKRVLVLGAHPDDEMGCSGTIARLARAGASVHVVVFSRCSDLNGPELVEEWSNGLDALGVGREQAKIHDLPNRQLPDWRQEILVVLDSLLLIGYDLILCPATFDSHQDHATVAEEARRAFKHSTVLGYELPVNAMMDTRLSAYTALSEVDMQAKQLHAAQFQSQKAKPYMNRDYINGLARVRGVQSGTTFAEAFEVIRWVI